MSKEKLKELAGKYRGVITELNMQSRMSGFANFISPEGLLWYATVSPLVASCISTLIRRLNDGIVDYDGYRYAYFLWREDLISYERDRKRSYEPFAQGIRVLDKFVIDYIDANPGSKILNAACGFCSRYRRVMRTAVQDFEWTDLDLPDVINLRLKADAGKHLGENHRYVGQNVFHYKDIHKFDLVISETFIYHFEMEFARDLLSKCKRWVGNVLGEDEELTPLQFWKYKPDQWSVFDIEEIATYDKGNKVILVNNVKKTGTEVP